MKPYPDKRRRFSDQRQGNRPPFNHHRHARGRGGGRGRGRGGPPGPVVDASRIEEQGSPSPETLSVAVLGCCHGEIGAVYDRIQNHEKETGRKVDLLVCCGDFQSLRTWEDFHSLAVPPKYRNSLGSFLPYYINKKVAPLPTIVIGGNHEASQALQELYYGGWLAPSIYYMGAAGVVRYRGLRIAGLGGIFKHYSFRKPHWERPPYDPSNSLRSVYHVREVDVARLRALAPPLVDKTTTDASPDQAEDSLLGDRVDIMLSHDWPRGIEQFGNLQALLRKKPFFREDIDKNELGNPAGYDILKHLKPRHWFAAHLHVRFQATVPHQKASAKQSPAQHQLTPSQVITAATPVDSPQSQPESEQAMTTDFLAVESKDPCGPPDLTEQMTQFLALDKCLPHKPYLSILHIPVKNGSTTTPEGSEPKLEYDVEWLTILKKTHGWTAMDASIGSVTVSREEVEETKQQLQSLVIPETFSPTLPLLPETASTERIPHPLPPPLPQMGNPQTDQFLRMLGLGHCQSGITIPYTPLGNSMDCEGGGGGKLVVGDPDDNEIDLEDM